MTRISPIDIAFKITSSNSEYYLANDLASYDPIFFGNIVRRADFLKKSKVPENSYVYAYEKNDKYIITDVTYKKAKIYIKKTWADANIPKLIAYYNTLLTDNNPNELPDINDMYDVPPAPDILELDDDEKFKDKHGQSIEIEVRGQREYDKCYFKVKDIMNGFGLPSLQNNIINESTSYELNTHYIFFNVKKNDILLKNNIKKELFLTHIGVLKVLFSSRTGNAENFQHWCSKILFTVQMGTENSKYELVKSMFGGASIHAVKEAFKTSSGKTPCVYLFVIGNANELLKTDKYSSDSMLYKFGQTDDLPRRSGEHERNFKRMFQIDHIELMLFSVIDPKYIVDAETSLKKFFETNIVDYKNTQELIVLNKQDYTKTIQHYKLIKNTYIGCYMEMHDKIDKLERKLKDLQNEYDLTKEKLTNQNDMIREQLTNELKIKDKNIELIEKEFIIKDKEFELQTQKLHNELKLKDRDLEIMHMKYKMLEEQLNHVNTLKVQSIAHEL